MKKFKVIFAFVCLLAFFSEAKNVMDYYANKAEEAWNKGLFEDALDYAHQEIIDYDNNPNGYYQAAISYCYLQQPGQALSMFNKAIEKAKKKDKSFLVQCYGTKAQLLEEMGDTVQSFKALNDGLKIDKNNTRLLMARANLYMASDKQMALKDLEKIKKLEPHKTDAYINIAYIYFIENRLNEALDEINTALNLDSSSAYSFALRGHILQKLGYYPVWIEDCLKSYELDEDQYLGVILLAMEEDAYVKKDILEVMNLNYANSERFEKLKADLLYAWNEYQLAVKSYQNIINRGNDNPEIYYSLSDCQKELGLLVDAYASAAIGLDKNPDDIKLRLMKAQIGVMVGKGAEVLDLLDSLIAEQPDNAELYTEKGKAYMSMAQYSEAVEPFAMAVILNPSALNKMFYGDALRLSGNVAKANSEYNEILKMSESKIAEQGERPQYIYALAYSGLGKKDEAFSALKALSEEQENAEMMFSGMILARIGLKHNAIAAIKNYSQNGGVWNAMLDLYSYNFHKLHDEPNFAELLRKNGVNTKFNYNTQLLEYVPDNMLETMGGTSLEYAMSQIANNPADWVYTMNKLCPIDLGLMGQIVFVDFDEKTQTIMLNYSINPELLNFKEINRNPSYKRKFEDVMMMDFISENSKIADSGLTLKYNYRAADGSDKTTFVITPARLKELKRKSLSQTEMDRIMLDFWLEDSNIDNQGNSSGSKDTVTFDGKIWNVIINVSESDGTFARLELFKSDLRNQYYNIFNDRSSKVQIDVFLRQNITLKYTIQGESTGKKIEFVFTPEELSRFVK